MPRNLHLVRPRRSDPELRWNRRLPLYRQAEMMAAQGIDIDRSTLAGWAGQASALLEPQAYIADVIAKIAGDWPA